MTEDNQGSTKPDNEKSLEKLWKYRDSLEELIATSEKDYHTTITYIAAGGLAFFLTINDKFFEILKGSGYILFITSIALLFVTILLYIINIVVDIKASEKLRELTDSMITERKHNKEKLGALRHRSWKTSRRLTYMRFWSLGIGIFLELMFIVINLKGGDHAKEETKIEVSIPQGISRVSVDTLQQEIRFKIH